MPSSEEALANEMTALFSGERLADPYPILNEVRETAAVLPMGSVVMVARYEDVQNVLVDEERYSNEIFIRGSRAMEIKASFTPEGQRRWQYLADRERNHITRTEGEKHERLRKSVHRYFTPRRIQAMAPRIQEFIDDLLDEVADRETYDQKWLAGDLALRVMSDIVGSPQVDREYLRGLVDIRSRAFGTAREDFVYEAYDAHVELAQYIQDVIIAEHRRNPGANEFADALMAAEDEDRLSSDELVGVVINVIIGGLHTTAALLSNGLVEFMRAHDQWDKLCADPELAAPAIEELLRFAAPIQWGERIAKYDFTWDGVDIPAETTVMTVLAAANRDPRMFERPDTFDITRNSRHLGLGHGPHHCLGASVIRHEGRILLETLATRYPDLELALDPAELDWSGGNPAIRALRTLPIRLGPRRA